MGRQLLPPQIERKCHYCKLVKPIDNFYTNSSVTDATGRMYVCKPCNSIKTRETKWRRDIRQKGLEAFVV